MRYFTAQDVNELKSQYRKLAFELHPDMGGDAKAFSEMKLEYEELFKTLKDRAFEEDPEHNAEWTSDDLDDGYAEIIEVLLHLKGITIELCGAWLWLSGDTKPVKDQLKAAGCRWAAKKGMWYWRPSDYSCRHNRRTYSMSYIRTKYGSQRIVAGKTNEIEA